MASLNTLPSQDLLPSSLGKRLASGRWKLGTGRALTLQARESGVLRVEQGQVWVTFDAPHHGLVDDLGDHFLRSGQEVALPAGKRLVMESWSSESGSDVPACSPVYFSWTPQSTRPTQAAAPAKTTRGQAAVVQPLRELCLALGVATLALGRLLLGIAGYAEYLVAGRGRVLPPLESNPP